MDTDAAKLINGSTDTFISLHGLFLLASKTERKHRTNSATSINTAELIAIDDALKFVKEEGHHNI